MSSSNLSYSQAAANADPMLRLATLIRGLKDPAEKAEFEKVEVELVTMQTKKDRLSMGRETMFSRESAENRAALVGVRFNSFLSHLLINIHHIMSEC